MNSRILAAVSLVLVLLLNLSSCSLFRTPAPSPTPLPSPKPTATPAPYFGLIAFAERPPVAGQPSVTTHAFPPGTKRVCAIWAYEGMADGIPYSLRWYWNGALWREESYTWDAARDGAAGAAKYAMLEDVNGLISGDYRLELILGGQTVQLATFRIESPPIPTPTPTMTIAPTRTPSPVPTVAPTMSTEWYVQQARNALVKIWVPDDRGQIAAEASGSIVDSRGLILTNWHVLWYTENGTVVARNTAGEVYVGLFRSPTAPAAMEYVAQYLTYDPTLDLAVFQIVRRYQGAAGPIPAAFPTVPLGNSDLLDAPDAIFILGYPAVTHGYPSVTRGIMSGRARDETGEWITTDTEIGPGNSGGMALNARGELIGIPSPIWYRTDVPARMGYVRPLNLARPLLEAARLLLARPWPTPAPPPPSGLVVGGRAYVTAPDGLNVRSGPGLGYAVLWKAPVNTTVTILAGPHWANVIPWYQITVDEIGLAGWCSGNYLAPLSPGEPPPEPLIAFASDRGGNYDIYVMRSDGSTVQNLTQHRAKDGSPSWSPNRRWIAFSSDRGGDDDIYLLDLGSGLNPPAVIPAIQGPGDQIHPAWARDGERLAYVSNEDGDWEIYIARVDGSEKRQLTHNAAWDSFPTWSPDGREIVFTSGRDGNLELYAVDVATGAERRLTNHPASDAFPAYAPDGARIALVSARSGLLEVYIADPRNVEGTLVQLTDSRAAPYYNRHPDWSPDGRWLVFTSWRDGQGEIYRISAAGRGLKRLTIAPGDDVGAAWGR